MYGFVGLGFAAGFCYHFFTLKAQEYIGSMFVNVCFNFTPFLSQVITFIIGAQTTFPGVFTAFGGAVLFIGCTLLAMNYQDQQEMAHVPVIELEDETDQKEIEMKPVEVMQMPINPGYSPEELH